MPYYGDSTPYYYGGAFSNHSSLMTGLPRSLHNPLSGRFAPHLSTITESSLSNLRRYSPVSTTTTRIRRVIDTADIDVSTPRTLSSRDEERQRGNRLRRDRPTIKIRSQALKDNPALREHNEKHEKSVGELLVEKFLIKEKKSNDDEESRPRVYHQVSLDRSNDNNQQDLQSIQRRITRRMTRRRSSADIQLDPEQLQREVAYAQVQAKVLDSLVAEEQAEIEDEVRRGTLIRKGLIRGSKQVSSFFEDDTDVEFVATKEEERGTVSKAKKTFKKTKKKKKVTEKPSPTEEDDSNGEKMEEDALETKRSSTTPNEMVVDDSKENGVKEEDQDDGKSPTKSFYKVEASNSVGDFSTIWINATSGETEEKQSVEQFRESIRIPVPRKAASGVKRSGGVATVPENGIPPEEAETEIVLPVRKPYIKDTSRNSVYLTLKTPDKGNKKAKVKDTDTIPTTRKMLNGVDALTKKDLLKLRVRDTLQKVLEIGTETNEDASSEKTSKISEDIKEKIVPVETKVDKVKKITKSVNEDASSEKPSKISEDIKEKIVPVETKVDKVKKITKSVNEDASSEKPSKISEDIKEKIVPVEAKVDKVKKITKSVNEDASSEKPSKISEDIKEKILPVEAKVDKVKKITKSVNEDASSEKTSKISEDIKEKIVPVEAKVDKVKKITKAVNEDASSEKPSKITEDIKEKIVPVEAKVDKVKKITKSVNEDASSEKPSKITEATKEKIVPVEVKVDKVKKITKSVNEDVSSKKPSKITEATKEKIEETKVEKITKPINDKSDLPKIKDDVPDKSGKDKSKVNAETMIKTIDNSDTLGTEKSTQVIDKASKGINNVKNKSTVDDTDERSKLIFKKVDTKKVPKTNEDKTKSTNVGDNESIKNKSDISIKSKGIVVRNDTGENSAAMSSVLTPSALCLPKPSKINTDENNAVEAPELSLRAAAYLANPPKIANFEDAAASLPGNTVNEGKETLKRIPPTKRIDETRVTGGASNAIDSVTIGKDVRATKNNDSGNIITKDLPELQDTSKLKNMSLIPKSMTAGGDRKEVDGTATVLSRKMPTNSTYTNKSGAAFQNSILGKDTSLVGKESVMGIPATTGYLTEINKLTNGTEIINETINEKKIEVGVSKSESTESIDFWNEIKSNESKDIRTDSKPSSSSIKKQPNDKRHENDSKISIAPNTAISNNATTTSPATNVRKERGTIVKSPLDETVKTKEEITSSGGKENNKKTMIEEKGKTRKKADLVISIPPLRDVTSTVKRKNPLIKREESSDKTPTSTVSTPSTPTLSETPTPVNEISVPVINIIEAPTTPATESQTNEVDEEEECPSTPTNEWTDSPIAQISKWNNYDDLTNSDDLDKTMTPASSNDASLVATPNDSQQASPESSKKKKIVKKRKPSSKKTTNEEADKKDTKESRNEVTSSKTYQDATTTLKLPESKTSPRSSPRNSPTQRPIDLIRMFYTTPSALLTATPRDLSKVRRAKIKRKKHQSRTPSVSSDSTGSTASTATTGSTDGSSASTCTELDDDPEHKRMASTRSNDSGFDGSPRISNCDMACHKKCEKLTGNLCGLNQKLVAEALQALKKAPSQSLENQRNTDTPDHFPSGRITPPAINLPRFKKYAVEDFNFLKVLGKGSFGKVLLAELRGTECVYAVKCLKKDVVLEDDDVECTLIERKVLTLATRHPYLCHLFCTFQTESHLFFVMEYLNGGDLMFHIQKSGRFAEARARFYAAEIWSGLNFLHKKGIVYRDLKLDNVLLDFEGHIRIADFGMCKLQIFLDRTADTFCGTPDYMAPEIIKGLKYNQSVDWWSYGVLLYEMLTGQSPFSGCDEDELFWSICNERPFIPRYLGQEATDILVLLLEKDSGKRPPAHEIAIHPFFQSLPWDRLERRQLEPPFKPALDHTLDTKYFDTAFTAERPRLTPVPEQILSSMDQGVFRGFSYTNPNATD